MPYKIDRNEEGEELTHEDRWGRVTIHGVDVGTIRAVDFTEPYEVQTFETTFLNVPICTWWDKPSPPNQDSLPVSGPLQRIIDLDEEE